jgi:hypothetical protein
MDSQVLDRKKQELELDDLFNQLQMLEKSNEHW